MVESQVRERCSLLVYWRCGGRHLCIMTNEQAVLAPYIPLVSDPLGHASMHGRYTAYVEYQIERWRPLVGIAPVWAIEVRLFCSDEMPAYEGYCTWDAEKFYAEMGICCALSVAGIEWVLLTELCELQGHREGDLVAEWTESLPGQGCLMHGNLLREFQYVRNQTIEERVQALLGGKRRPFSLRYQEAS